MTTELVTPTVSIYLAGEFVEAGSPLEVSNPADGSIVATTFQAGPDELERATAAAVAAFDETKRMPSYARRDALAHVATSIERDADELADAAQPRVGQADPRRPRRGRPRCADLPHRRGGGDRASPASGCRSTRLPPTRAGTGSSAATPSDRWPGSARSTSRSTWRRTRSRRRLPPAAASFSSRRPRTR